MYENQMCDGVPSLLEELLAASRQLVEATSGPTVFAEKIMDHFGLRAFFDNVIGSNLDGTSSPIHRIDPPYGDFAVTSDDRPDSGVVSTWILRIASAKTPTVFGIRS